MSEEVKLINEFKSELINHLISRINNASEILDSVFTFDLLRGIILNLDYEAVKGKDYSFEVKIILILNEKVLLFYYTCFGFSL